MKLGKKVLVIALTVAALSTTVVGTALAAQGDTSSPTQNTTTRPTGRHGPVWRARPPAAPWTPSPICWA